MNASSSSSRIDREVHTLQVRHGESDERLTIVYTNVVACGHGSFGTVVKAEIIGGGQRGLIAIKRTKQDRRFKNRELQIMKLVEHPNIIRLRYYAQQDVPEQPDELELLLVLDYYPQTTYRHYRDYVKKGQRLPEILIKVHMFQLLRAIAYLHAAGICHRDIKPQNLLLDPATGVLKLIDFGSAKVLKPGSSNVAYTCSRYYRSPELIFGCTTYTHAIDIWSAGCVFGEFLLGGVLFPGTSGIDQLVEIIKVLGTPTKEQVMEMNRSYSDHVFPQIQPVPFVKLLPSSSAEAHDLLASFLQFDPVKRLSALESLVHPFFDELREGKEQTNEHVTKAFSKGTAGSKARLPNGSPLPRELFLFTRLELSIDPSLARHLVPDWAVERVERASGVDVRLGPFDPINNPTGWIPDDVGKLKAKAARID